MDTVLIKDLTKEYDNFKLGPIDLTISKGQIVGLIGSNGAGKTTLIKSILKVIKPTKGNVSFQEGLDFEDIGIVLDNTFLPEILTVKDVNTIMTNIFKTWDKELYFKLVSSFGLNIKSKIKTLSKGMRKKLEIAASLAHHPKLLILDEPTSGLDPVVRSEVLDLFLEFIQNEENTIIFSTHITTDLEHIADKIVFIDKGLLVLEENKDDIIDNYGVLKCDLEDFKMIDKDDIVRFKKNKYSYDILIKDRNKLGKKYKDFVIDKATLEDLMILIVKGEK